MSDRTDQQTRPRMATHGLDLPAMCDICGKARSKRNHANCSKTRQHLKNDEWKSYMANVDAKRRRSTRRSSIAKEAAQ